ncbi:metallohydrolase [Paraburkholderia strydomiana]|nr:metallohydrolase [Paraburkholderia strydomiana]
MTLIKLSNGQTILIDINIRALGEGVRDVLMDLREKLSEDEEGRPYVDVMVLSHPDQDHCRGLEEHFHLGSLFDYPVKGEASKIVIREMWSSPLVYRRASKKHTLSDDAKAWNTEAKRRVQLFKDEGILEDGDRIQIMGEDADGKTDDVMEIVIRAGERITKVAGKSYENFSALLLAPRNAESDEDAEELTKNESSIIINYSIGTGATPEAVKFLSAGDAEVYIWDKKLWPHYKNQPEALEYDLLSTPHHCSWHTLSYESWSGKGEEAKVCEDTRKALSQTRAGAYIVASSNKIVDDKNDPPCIRAEREYKSIAKDAGGTFLNTAIHPSVENPEPMTFEVYVGGVKPGWKNRSTAATTGAAAAIGSQPLSHGSE